MPFITYPQPNGQVAVIIPCEGATKFVKVIEEVPILDEEGNPTGETNMVTREESVPMTIEDIAAKDVPEGLPYKIVESLDLDNDFFNAYDFHPDNGVAENISRAQTIQLNTWRDLRAPLLSKLDVYFSMALERSDTTSQATIASQKQALRDVTKTELPSDTIANIKAVIPSILTQQYTYPIT